MRSPSRHLLVVALVSALALPSAASARRTLHPGDHNPAVRVLQRALGLHPDGIFGPGTGRAVKRFQRRHHLHADGVVGSATWHALARRGSSARVSSRGGAVRLLQRRLGIAADGIFGPGTRRALKRFQRTHGLTADGVAGPATWRALGVRGRHAVLKAGHARRRVAHRSRHHRRGSAVRLLQRRLGIAADGIFGPGTRRALRRFQRAHGLTADGVAGPATWSALGLRGRHPLLRGHRGGARVVRGGAFGRIASGIAAANRIARYPYRYGGGHRSFHDSGYDCSGSVSYVLHAMGVLSSPLDSSQLMSYGAPGPGRWVTIYSNPGHAYMTIRGRRFDTSAQWQGGSRWSIFNRSSAGYTVRHPPGL
jgi:peptidoglycan hydrolase-like protein with peptidoglycan-binding domain